MWRSLLLSTLLFACAEEAPTPNSHPSRRSCGSLAERAPLFVERSQNLPAFRKLISEDLEREQGNAALDGLLRILRAISPEDLSALLDLMELQGLEVGLEVAEEILHFIGGDPQDPSSFQEELLLETQRVLAVCDGEALFEAVYQLLEAPELASLLENVAALAASQELPIDPAEAFDASSISLLLRNIMLGISSPDFDFELHVVHPMAEMGLPIDEPPASALVQDLSILLAPERGLLSASADLFCCTLYAVPRCDELSPGMEPVEDSPTFSRFIFEIFIHSEGAKGGLNTLGAMMADPKVRRAMEPLRLILKEYAEDIDQRRAAVGMLHTLLEPEILRGLIPEILSLLDRAILDELTALLRALTEGCH